MSQGRGRGLRGSQLVPARHRGRGWQGFLWSGFDGDPAAAWMASGYKAATDDAVWRTWAPRGVFERYGPCEKETKFISLSLACVAQRCIYLRLASHLGPTLPKKERGFWCFHFLNQARWGRKRGGERGRAKLQLRQSGVLDLSQACCPPNLYESCMENPTGFSTVSCLYRVCP